MFDAIFAIEGVDNKNYASLIALITLVQNHASSPSFFDLKIQNQETLKPSLKKKEEEEALSTQIH
ncbi:hypothetical protein ERO13_A12G085000v2 [Gossypium hirsutum]|nr:hypothetical protein ERO13_A12G085000v2 [Gossypium hirsutum]